MAEEWRLEGLERRIDGLQKQVDEAKDNARKEKEERSDRNQRRCLAVVWTFYVVALTTMVVLGATGHLHHH